MSGFSEEILDLGYDYGASGGPQWSVTTTVSGGGYEKANLDWSQPLGEYRIGDRTGENCLTLHQYEDLYNFWMARRGSFQGFRFKDWGDFELIEEPIGIGDGVKTIYQVIKTYGDFKRIIKKIEPEGFLVRVGNVYSTFALNPNTGTITFSTPPVASHYITVTGEFHVPVRFNENAWPGKFYAADPARGERWFELGALTLRAIRV